MKIFFTFSCVLFSSLFYSQSVQPFLKPIVGQFPNVRDMAMTRNQSEVVFTAQSFVADMSALVSAKKVNGEWGDVQVVSFSGRYFDMEPFFSKDGLTLYFVSNRPLDQISNVTKDFDIWYVTRENLNEKWSEPINMGAPVNTDMDEFYPIITDSKNLYFTLDNPILKQKDNIYVSEFVNGDYTQPKQLGSAINSDGYEFNAFVSSDESYLIYTCYNKEGGLGSGDLYMSTKSEKGEWSPARNMGIEINSDKMDYCPFVDESTNTLYFTSKRNGLKPTFESPVDLKELLNIFNSYENRLSRLYQVTLDSFITKKNP